MGMCMYGQSAGYGGAGSGGGARVDDPDSDATVLGGEHVVRRLFPRENTAESGDGKCWFGVLTSQHIV